MSAARQNRRIKGTSPVCVAVLCAATAILAGCGGASTQSTTSAQKGRQTPAPSSADAPASQAGTVQAAAGASRQGSAATTDQGTRGSRAVGSPTKIQTARATPGSSKDDHNVVGASPLNPCKLVRRSEAQAIAGGAIAAGVEAPLGPTCIYRLAASNSSITLAVQSAEISQIKHQMTKPDPVSVGNRRGYCGKLGQETLLLPIAPGRTLTVTAPCAIARRFAVIALSRLAA